MKKIEFLETFNTEIGLLVIVKDNSFKVGDIIENQDGYKYRIKAVIFPSRPPLTGQISLRVEPL